MTKGKRSSAQFLEESWAQRIIECLKNGLSARNAKEDAVSEFTGILAEIDNVIGAALTLKLVSECGGSTIYIPKNRLKNAALSAFGRRKR